MRRLLFLLLLAVATVARASAQSEASVYIRLFPDTLAGPHARVRVMSLLDDPEWRNAVTKSYPVRLDWSVQLWQKGWFGKAGPKAEWRDVIQWNSILEVYQLTSEVPGERVAPQQFRSLDMLALQMGRPIELSEFGPKSPGNWYYRVTLKISTLNADDLAKLDKGTDPSVLEQLFNKALMNFKLPTRTYTDESPVFRWR